MRKHLLSTVCYPVLNLAVNIHIADAQRKTPEYKQAQAQAHAARYKAIVMGRPYQPLSLV
jgi:hypothetical protein